MHDQIGTLRTHGAARDALALRGAAERALAGLTLAPAALPDAAILCLRRVQARADLQQALQGRAMRQAAVQAQAQVAWATADRPANGPVSAASPAVWFADEAELLACLAQDALRGSTQAWWWAALLGPTVDAAAVQRRWLAQAAAAPAAMQLLACWGQATAVLGAWPPAFCTQLSAQLAGLYGVSGWPPPPRVDATAPAGPGLAQAGDAPAPAAGPGQAVWQALLLQGPDLRGLAPAQQQLGALACLLARTPAQASQPGVATALQGALAKLAGQGGPPPATALPAGDASARRAARAVMAAPASGPAAPLPGPGDNPAHQPGPAGTEVGLGQPSQPPVGASATQARSGAGAGRGPGSAVQHTAADALVPPPSPAHPQLPAQPAPTASLATATRPQRSARSPHAGLLYALRLAMQLGLYGDFSQPRRPGIALPPADWLALLGLHLFGPALQQDPLWPLLSAWAGRAASDAPGLGFQPASGQALQPWLAAQVRHCQHLARQALPQQRQALRWLCQRPGRWVLSSNRLDAYFALADHPLAIRQAGLDRDPGWLPAAGLSIWLHFD